jgi:hypothetical protein
MLLQGDARFEPALDSRLNCGATRKETAGSHVRDIPQLRGAATLPQNQCELRKLCFAMRPSSDSQATNCSVLSLPFQERAGRAKSEVLLDLPSQVTYEYRANRCGIPWAICSAPRRLFLSRQLSHQGM